MKFKIKENNTYSIREWYIVNEQGRYLWKNLKLHTGTGWTDISMTPLGLGRFPGDAPGYYKTKKHAELALRMYKHLQLLKEKHNMEKDRFEINVKLNGIDVPLYKVSDQTLLNLKEASKPKPVPVFQVCETVRDRLPRLMLKITKEMTKYVGKYIALNKSGEIVGTCINGKAIMDHTDNFYVNARELKLEDVV